MVCAGFNGEPRSAPAEGGKVGSTTVTSTYLPQLVASSMPNLRDRRPTNQYSHSTCNWQRWSKASHRDSFVLCRAVSHSALPFLFDTRSTSSSALTRTIRRCFDQLPIYLIIHPPPPDPTQSPARSTVAVNYTFNASYTRASESVDERAKRWPGHIWPKKKAR